MEQINLAHMPPELSLYATYFSGVENTSFLRDQLLAGNAEFEYAFIDASVVVSRKHVLAATWRAMNDLLHDRLKSRNIHSEIVFALSPNNNIGEAFRRFGISEATKNLIVLKVTTDPAVTLDNVSRHLATSIKGQQGKLSDPDLRAGADIARVRKVYKLDSAVAKTKKLIHGISNEQEDEQKDLEIQILGMMALRGAT